MHAGQDKKQRRSSSFNSNQKELHYLSMDSVFLLIIIKILSPGAKIAKLTKQCCYVNQNSKVIDERKSYYPRLASSLKRVITMIVVHIECIIDRCKDIKVLHDAQENNNSHGKQGSYEKSNQLSPVILFSTSNLSRRIHVCACVCIICLKLPLYKYVSL